MKRIKTALVITTVVYTITALVADYWYYKTHPFEANCRRHLFAELGLDPVLNILTGGSK